MKCDKTMDIIYEHSGEPMPVISHLRVALHLLFCPACAQENERLEVSRDIFRSDFFPITPDLEESIMHLAAETDSELLNAENTEIAATPGGLSIRAWVITGIIILLSLVSAYFGMDFNRLAHSEGVSFLLPVGITFGIVLTTYGILFIGSHLKELSERFGL